MAAKIYGFGEKTVPNTFLDQFYYRDQNQYCVRPICDKTCQWWNKKENKSCFEFSEVNLDLMGPGVAVRKAIIARKGFLIVSIDFSQIEIRVAAQLSKEPLWCNAFNDETLDLHTEMAKVVFKATKPTVEERGKAKAANFGLIFAGGPGALQRQSDLSFEECVEVHHKWWAAVPIYKRWADNQMAIGWQSQQVETYFGRIRHLQGMISAVQSSYGKQGGGKKLSKGYVDRTTLNTPIQGTAADLMKFGMVNVADWIESSGNQDNIHILTTVHDELVLEIREDENFVYNCKKVSSILSSTPPRVLNRYDDWTVPIKTDIEVGHNWAELMYLKEYEELHLPVADGAPPPPVPEETINNGMLVEVAMPLVNDTTYYKFWNAIHSTVADTDRDDCISVPLYLEGCTVQNGPKLPRQKTQYRVSPSLLVKRMRETKLIGIKVREC